MMKPLTLTIADTQEILRLGRTTLYALLAEGRLRSIKIGRRTLITMESVEQLIDRASAAEAI